jgi:hypothetical protein
LYLTATMQGNDLSNFVVARDVLVFEGLLGLIPDAKVARQEAKFREKKRWAEALACYEINELLARKIWDMVWRYSLEIDLVTYHPPGFAKVLEERMDRENLPLRKVWSEEPNMLARRLATMPDIRTIYDPFPDHQFLYGGKGRIISPEQAHRLFGSM